MRNLINSQISYINLACWSREVLADFPYFALSEWLIPTYYFAFPIIEFNRAVEDAKNSTIVLRDTKFSKILDQKYYEILHESRISTNEILEHGAYSAITYLIHESYWVSFSLGPDIVNDWLNVTQGFIDIDHVFYEIISHANAKSQEAIQTELNMIIVSLVCYGIITLLLYFGFYVRFFNEERENLKKMQVIYNLVPIKALTSHQHRENKIFTTNERSELENLKKLNL